MKVGIFVFSTRLYCPTWFHKVEKGRKYIITEQSGTEIVLSSNFTVSLPFGVCSVAVFYNDSCTVYCAYIYLAWAGLHIHLNYLSLHSKDVLFLLQYLKIYHVLVHILFNRKLNMKIGLRLNRAQA
jgi:hypothetical protein